MVKNALFIVKIGRPSDQFHPQHIASSKLLNFDRSRTIVGIQSNLDEIRSCEVHVWLRVGITDQQLLRQLESGRAKDIRLFVQAKEINSLSSMFMQCSFYLLQDERIDRSRQISSYVVDIPLDEEH